MHAKQTCGKQFAENGLLLSPGIAQMYTTGEIAANICLETPGLDTLDILVLWKGFPTYASTQTIFTILRPTGSTWSRTSTGSGPRRPVSEVAVPGQHETALAVPWGGTSHPVWFKNDPRVANVKVLGGVFDRAVMEGVADTMQMVEEQIKPLPPDEQDKALAESPPRSRPGCRRGRTRG